MTRLAWRNIWRNRRRSLLTLASIACGLAAVMLAQSLMKTMQRQMIEKSTGAMSGHLQAQAPAAGDRKFPDRTIPRPAGLEAAMRRDPRVREAAARLLFTGLVYSAAGSRGVLVAGVEPGRELGLSIMPSFIVDGTYFGTGGAGAAPAAQATRRAGAPGIVLGDKLARDLDVRVGERLVVMAQDRATGEMNTELFRVAGIHHAGSEIYDGQVVYVPLEASQRLRGEAGRVSCLVARLADHGQAGALQLELSALARDAGAVLVTYEQIEREIVGIQRWEDALLSIVLAVISVIVGLGILNTMAMSLYERVREFGVIRAMGARPATLVGILLAEGAMLGAMGSALGLALGLAVIGWFGARGLEIPVGDALAYFIPFENVLHLRPAWGLHLRSAALIAAVSVLAAAGPGLRAARLRVAEALRHV